MAMMCRGFRGATTASDNTSPAIVEATEELLRALVEANDLGPRVHCCRVVHNHAGLDGRIPRDCRPSSAGLDWRRSDEFP